MAAQNFPVSTGDVLYASGINFLYGLGSSVSIGTTAEGVFPKSDGDLLYPSEINRINPKIFGYVYQHTYENVYSGTDFSVIGGSVLYTGSPAMSDYIMTKAFVNKPGYGISLNARLRYSGTTINITSPVKWTTNNTWFDPILFNHILTSGTLTASGGNVGSSFVIFLEAKVNGTMVAIIDDIIVTGH